MKMELEVTTFGLMHPASKRFARFINTEDEVGIFHRLNSDMTTTTYRDEPDELRDNCDFLESDELGVILNLIATNEWEEWNDEPDLDDFSAFVPVAIIRGKRRLGGVGDFIDIGMKVMLVIPKDATGTEYELSELLAD
jgi:hypothetical protein